MKPAPGTLVDFYSEGEIVAGVVLAEEKGKLRVATEKGREERIAPARVLAAYEADKPTAAQGPDRVSEGRIEAARRAAREHSRAARERCEGVDLSLVWELLVDEGKESNLEALAELATGSRETTPAAATLRKLLEEKIHFTRRAEMWKPRPREIVEEMLRQRARELERADQRERFLARVRAALVGSAPFTPSADGEEEALIRALESLAVEGASSGAAARQGLGILGELEVRSATPEEGAFRVLHAIGHFEEHENLFLRKFAVQVSFPPGAAEAARRAASRGLGEGWDAGIGTSRSSPAVCAASSAAADEQHRSRPEGPARPGQSAGRGAESQVRPETPAPVSPSAGGRTSRARTHGRGELPAPLAEEIAAGRREDLTGLDLFSIDDELTSEIDDALSVEVLARERARVGIHIADPGYFVPPGCELDRIALARAVTLYLPERRVLMLPRAISERASSLLAGAVRPSLSFFATFGPGAEIIEWRIVPSVIRSRERVTYEQAGDALESGAELPSGGKAGASGAGGLTEQTVEQIRVLHRLALVLEAGRLAAGAHPIRAPEVDLRVGPDGAITLKRLEGDDPGRVLVSEMMVLAGRLAARHCLERGVPCIYRRQPPAEEAFPPLTGGPYDPVAVRRARRGLRRSTSGLVPGRHYALGLDAYAQATSPIRRYQDLVIHRQIQSTLAGGSPVYDEESLQKIAATTDEAERVARLAERGSDGYWTLRYLERKIGEEVEGVVVFVEMRRVEVELSETLYTVAVPPRPDHELGQRLRFVVETVKPRAALLTLAPVD